MIEPSAKPQRILLINTNRMRPPIAPIGLDYLAAALAVAGHRVDLLDLCFAADPAEALDSQLSATDYQWVGLTLRNTDDCYYPGRSWFVPEIAQWVKRIQTRTSAPVVLGGVGFSVMPSAILEQTAAQFGIVGEGEFAMARLVNGDPTAPGLCRRDGMRWVVQPMVFDDLAALPPMRRDFVENARHHAEGGQLGFETKRGCAGGCVYCADPVAKGRRVRLRPPQAIADELAGLADRGLVHLHTCDAEFNRPLDHALEVCRELDRRRLGNRIRWHAYCAPTPFPEDLAQAMRRAGCVGIDFGADSADDGMLRRLGRDFQAADLEAAAERCRRHGLVCMFDLLLGGPGETEASVRHSLAWMQRVAPDRVGLSVGVRVYPGTPLACLAAREPEALHGPGATSTDFAAPAYYLAPALGEGIFSLVRSCVGEDRRFFFSDPTDADRNYNYNANDVLVQALAKGYHGAYWDILRRCQEGLPPD